MSKVKVYVTSFCPYCVRAKSFLDRIGVSYESEDVSRDMEKRQWLLQTTGMRTVPQIFVGTTPVGGYDDMMAAHRAGSFIPLLDKEGVAHSAG